MSVTLNIGNGNAEKLAACLKNIAENISADDILEIVLKTPVIDNSGNEVNQEKSEKPTVTMTSREVADILGRPHTTVVKQIAKFLCESKKEGKESGFVLTSFVCSHRNKKSYPMYEMTENACKEYKNLVAGYGEGIKSVSAAIKRFEYAMTERFHPEVKTKTEVKTDSNFLLEGKPRNEYEEYCNIFDRFITGPAVEGREIAELTDKYKNFYEVMKATELKASESNKLEEALYGVAIEAEMQGFIYGFKLFDALLNKQLAIAI